MIDPIYIVLLLLTGGAVAVFTLNAVLKRGLKEDKKRQKIVAVTAAVFTVLFLVAASIAR